MTDDERLLATVGRGLGIVAMYSLTWGAEVTHPGKVVWFEPAADPGARGRPRPATCSTCRVVVERWLGRPNPPPTSRYGCRHAGAGLRATPDWYDEVRRELRLLALHHGDDYPVAKELSEVALQVEQERRLATGVDALDAAIGRGAERVDLTYRVPTSAATR